MATADDHITEAEQLLNSYKAGVQLGLRDGYTYLPGDVLTVARLLTDMAKVRLELERRAAENAATDRAIADIRLPEQLGNLDDYCMCPIVIGLAKHEADCPHHKPANDEGPVASSTEPSA